ncbi:MAG: Calx-beta domain-containing protein [Kineosporiaceae bacterium]
MQTHARTGRVRFLGTEPGHPLPARGLAASAVADPDAAGRAFLSSYGKGFGVEDPSAQLRTLRSVPGGNRTTAVRYQQLHHGVPVMGGELVVTVDAAGETLAANGEVSPDLDLDVTPRLSARDAARHVGDLMAKLTKVPAASWKVTAPVLSVYDPALLGAPGPAVRSLVWRAEATSTRSQRRETVLVNARTGGIMLHFDSNAEAKQRTVCNFKNVPTASETCRSPYVRSEGGAATGVPDVDLAYDYAGITYDFFKTKFGRDSLDGKGLPLVSTVKYCPDDASSGCPFANAFWNGSQMVYGDSYASADDVVGHELSHGVTEFTSGLFYYFQSGAINESFSDVFGELIDLTDGKGDDASSVRWQIGEDLPIGAIRDMMHPENFSNPDRMSSPYYAATTDDAGGVHTNSGLNNKAAALLVDGGSFNGQTVPALGTDKVARIYYEAATRLMTSATDYNDLFDVLPQACLNLVGTNSITSTDCSGVVKAVTATEMNLQPEGASVPETPVCDVAGQVRQDLVADDLENPSAGAWVRSATQGFGWAYPQYDNAPEYDGMNQKYATSGVLEMWGDDPDGPSDATITRKNAVTIPWGRKSYLRFAHAFGFEEGWLGAYDGGTVEYSTDNGATWINAGPLGLDGSFNYDSVDALGGVPGFSGTSGGYVTSRFDLSSLAGKSVKVRFRVASDASVGNYGWFIDDVQVYSCAAPLPTLAVSDAVTTEGGTATFTLTRTSSSGTASVQVATGSGSATSGGDFTAKAATTVSFAAGQTSVTVPVATLGDTVPEQHETFTLQLSNPVGVALSDATGTATITDDDAGEPARLTVSDPVVTEPDTGSVNATFTITRTGSTTEAVSATVATAAGTASAGSDFTAKAATVVTIPAGATSATVTVPVLGDTADEANETFTLGLTAPVRASIADASGTATIVDDEGTVTAGPATFFRAGDVRVTEGASGTTTLTFTVTRSGTTTGTGSVVVATAGDTATGGVDFTALAATTVSFAAGQTSKTVSVATIGDTIPEQHERFWLNLSSPVGGVVADAQAAGELTDTDAGTPARLSINDVTVVEGNSGSRGATFTVTRSGSTAEAVTVNVATVAVSQTPAATAGSDYSSRSGSVTIAAGQTTATVWIPILPNTWFEPNEYLGVGLGGAQRAAISDPTGVATVVDDD